MQRQSDKLHVDRLHQRVGDMPDTRSRARRPHLQCHGDERGGYQRAGKRDRQLANKRFDAPGLLLAIPQLLLYRGSLGRNQAGNDALLTWGAPSVTAQDARIGLELFFKEHEFIEMGRKRQYPHESWYRTAPYYYYFGHYYAGRLLSRLPVGERSKFAMELEAVILPHQEPDGSWWDYAMWDYHKPYGTAFAIMTLLRCDRMISASPRP